MNKKLLLFAFIILITFSGYSQKKLWSIADEGRLEGFEKNLRNSTPSKYILFSLDLGNLKQELQAAPLRSNSAAQSTLIMPFPGPDGKLEHYRVYEAPVLHPELAAKYPGIKSYVGTGIEDHTAIIRFSVSLFGLHTMTLSSRGTFYIDPYTKDLQHYIVYNKKNLKAPRTFSCNVIDDTHEDGRMAEQLQPMSVQVSDGVLRTYRLAMACTIEYASFHVNAAGLGSGTLAQKKAAVLAAMNTTMTRVNGIYEKDMAITMQLVPNNDDIIFITSDSFSNNNSGTLINQSQTVIDNTIGFNNYDIGHTVSTGGGGLAQLGCVCTTSKARGITGSPQPVGDAYDVDYVAHEMGHQFGANHTFNNSDQRNGPTAVEPGSGSTIMAYAGISPPNVQNNSDDYFHTVSLTQMTNFINGIGGSCAEETANNNQAPVIPTLQTYTIPRGTAFMLKGSATDADGDALTYCWEQTNPNGASSTQDVEPQPGNTTGPNFRSLPPSTSPNRYMPSLENVLNGNLTPTWEVVPSIGRTMSFALTVRDNGTPNGGQTARRDMNVIVTNNAGPFAVTSQNADGISWTQGSTQTITWNIAGTTANGVNTANVNILLSTDGGQTFETVLASNTPNDGSETIIVPNVSAPFCRIMVEAVGSIYYAVNSNPFAVGYTVTTTCNTYTSNTVYNIADGSGTSFPSLGSVVSSNISVPSGATISDVNINVNVSHTYIQDLVVAAYHPDNTETYLWAFQCGDFEDFDITFDDSGAAIDCGSPTVGTFVPEDSLEPLNGKSAMGTWTLLVADGFQGDTGTLNSWSIEICSQQVVAGVNEFGLANFTLYPNPNNGSFTIGFDSVTDSDIKIVVHDMRGREVYNRTYTNTGVFSGNVNLTGVQSGMYLVTVQDGSNKEVKKIVMN